MDNEPTLQVAVGVLLNDKNEVLVALRPEESHQGGLWEFPGGKVEHGESVEDALKREFNEELGLNILSSSPFMEIRHSYSDKSVMLNVCRIEAYSGIPQGKEGQPIAWRATSELQAEHFPKANERIISALRISK